jgi:hypothetical protein
MEENKEENWLRDLDNKEISEWMRSSWGLDEPKRLEEPGKREEEEEREGIEEDRLSSLEEVAS